MERRPYRYMKTFKLRVEYSTGRNEFSIKRLASEADDCIVSPSRRHISPSCFAHFPFVKYTKV
jgi:hypothetical protein